jgi:hypothetical protein
MSISNGTIIQIKRSTTTAVPGALSQGELAYSSNGEVLYIGSPVGTDTANVVAIGGKRTPGTLTANQALVANSTSGIDKVIVANLVATQVYANGSVGNSGYILASGNTGNVYWLDPATLATSASGSNTQVQFNSNGAFSGDADFTFDTSNNKLSVGGGVQIGNDSAFVVGSNSSVINSSGAFITGAVNTGILVVANTTSSSNTTTGAATVAGGLGVAGRINSAELAVGNTSVYTSVNGTIIQTGSVLATNTVNAATLSVGSWVVANDSGVFTSGIVNADIIQVGSKFKANTTQVTIANTVAISANGSTGSAGQVLTSNGSTVYWSTLTADITEVTAGNGLTGGGDSGSVTLDVGAGAGITVNANDVAVNAGDGIVANSSGTFVKAGTGVTVNATGVHIGQAVGTTSNVSFGVVNASAFNIGSDFTANSTTVSLNNNVIVGSSNSDTVAINAAVNTNIIPSANVTYNLGSEDRSWLTIHASNVHAAYATFDHNVTVSGNLYVSGNVVSINVETLAVTDSLIQLAKDNITTDTLDIGFYGNYNPDGGAHEHTGLFRDATDGRYKLFQGLTVAPTTTIDTGDASYSTATLQAYLLSGALGTNSTAVSITANSTVNVAIVANTLSLTTALGVSSGGTGKTSITNNAVLFGYGTGSIQEATGSNGQVLQISSNVPTFGGLDGGTF